MAVSSAICFIACHTGAAEHFAHFAKELSYKGKGSTLLATGPAAKKLDDLGVTFERIEIKEGKEQKQNQAREIAKKCEKFCCVITDIGDAFDLSLHAAFSERSLKHFAYYDNPEPYVPGGYSENAAKVMQLSQKVLFANANLVKQTLYETLDQTIQLPETQREAIGFYPLRQAKNIKELRKNPGIRNAFFSRWNMEDQGQKVCVYFGGNNDVYFEKAFPAFLSFLKECDLKNLMVVFQQHPGAKNENRDLKKLEESQIQFPVILSQYDSMQIQQVADTILYFQTSMAPQFALAGIPTIQVGHEPYHDILVRNHLASSVTSSEGLSSALKNPIVPQEEEIFSKLGVKEDYIEHIIQSF